MEHVACGSSVLQGPFLKGKPVLQVLSGAAFTAASGFERNPGMRQKYVLVRNDDKRQLLIREYAELDRGRMSLMCEETYPVEKIRAETARGKEQLVQALRTPNMYPPTIYLDQIADSVVTLLDAGEPSPLELFFDDAALLTKERQSAGFSGDMIDNDTV